MSAETVDRPPLPLDQVLAAGQALAAAPDLGSAAGRLRQTLESWASPSLVLCLEHEPGAPGGWRTVGELSWGAVSPGVERSLARMIEEAPAGSLARPTLLRTEVSAANVRPRDNVIIPWSSPASSGFLVLRGVPRPAPENLAEALALACLPLWSLVRRPPAAPQDPAPAAAASLSKRLETLERVRGDAEADRDRAEFEAAELRDRVEQLERQLEAVGAERRRLDSNRDAAARDDAAALGQRQQELEAARRELSQLSQRVQGLESERGALEQERNRLRTESHSLYSSIDSRERELQQERQRFAAERERAAEIAARLEQALAEAREARTEAEGDRDAARSEAAEALERAEEATSLAREVSERWEGTTSSFRAALVALRRTPFVPPTLRVSMSGAESALASLGSDALQPASLGIRVLLLDRDAAGLEPLAAELEAAGLDVLIAHHPDEVGFFLKTADARRLAAAVCDVMAFRGDQDVIEAFRAWREELPGLALFLSFKSDRTSEAERAQRVPSVLAAGYLKRPLESGPLVEALVALGRRPLARP